MSKRKSTPSSSSSSIPDNAVSNNKKTKTVGEREMDERMSQRERVEKKDWGWKEVLKECGYNDDDSNDCVVGVELQASLTALLKEMHHHGVDVNNERVLNQLQESATDIPTLRQWTSTSNSSWSLLKVLLRVEALQSTLLTSLMQSLVQLASDPTEDDDEDNILNGHEELAKRILSHFKWLDHIYTTTTKSSSNNDEEEEEEDGLLKSALECLSLLAVACSSENDDEDILPSHNTSYNICLEFLEWLPDLLAFLGHPQQDLVVETLIAMSQEQPDYYLLPSFDVLTTLQYHHQSSNNKSKQKSDKDDEDINNMSTLDKIIQFAQESLHPIYYCHDENDENNSMNYAAIPTLTQFLLQHAPPQQAIVHLLQQPFGSTTNNTIKEETSNSPSNDSQQKKRKGSSKRNNLWMSRMEAEAFSLEIIVKAFQYRSDLTKALFSQYNTTTSTANVAKTLLNSITHVWCLWACAVAPHNRNKVVSTISQLAGRHIWTPATIDRAISKHGSILLRGVLSQSSSGHSCNSNAGSVSPLLFLADALMQCSDASTRSLGGQMYKSLLLELHSDQHTDQAVLCQEIVAQLGMHIGSSTYSNNRNDRSTFPGRNNDSQEESYMALQVCTSIPPHILQPYRPFWFALLDHIQRLPPRHLRKLFLLLFSVTEDPHNNNNGNDDDENLPVDSEDAFSDIIHIVIRKHLSLSSPSMKRIGIIGAVAFAVTRSVQFNKSMNNGENSQEDDPKNNPLFGGDIIKMLETAYRHCTPLQTFRMQSNAAEEKNNDFLLSTQQEDSALAYYFDELCLAVQSKCLASDVTNWILDRFSADLENKYLGDFVDPQGDNDEETPIMILPTNHDKNHHPLASQQDAALLNGTSGNPRAPPATLRFNIDGEDSLVYVKFLTLLSSKKSFDRNVIPQQLCPLLRLLATCNDIRYGGEGLSEIDAILGCPLLLPSEKSVGIDFEDLSLEQKWTTTASTYYAACWSRELINCFIYTAAFPSLVPLTKSSLGSQVTTQEDVRQKVVEKIRCLVQLQEDLAYVASKCQQFTPPYQSILKPPPELVKLSHHISISENVEQKENDSVTMETTPPSKISSNDSVTPNNMDHEDDKTISSKMVEDEKKMFLKKAAALAKSKQKLIKLKSTYESKLGERSLQSLRQLSPAVCLALGFPELSLANQQPNCRRSSGFPENGSSQELMMTLGASQLKNFVVGGPVTTFLLSHLCDTLKMTLGSKNSSSRSRLAQLSSKTDKQSNNDDDMNTTANNPYILRSYISEMKNKTDKNKSLDEALNANKNFEFLEMCLKGNVFSAIHEHLATIAEIRGGMRETEDNDIQEETNEMKNCISLLFNSVTTITNFEELTRSSRGEIFLEVIFKQLADGDVIQTIDLRRRVTKSSLVKYAKNLFELIREIVTSRESDDLELMIEGINCLNSILLCSTRLQNLSVVDLSKNCDSRNNTLMMKKSLSNVCLQLLQRQWHRDTKLNKGNVGKLVSLYLEHSPLIDQNESNNFDILKFGRIEALTRVVDDILTALTNTSNCQGPLDSYPLCCSKTFAYFFSSAFTYLTKEIGFLFSSSISKSPISTGKTLDVLYMQVKLLDNLTVLTKENPSLAKRPLLLIQLKGGINFLEQFINKGIPYLEINFQDRQEGITTLINTLQRSTRQLTNILSFAKRERDSNLIKEAPRSKKILETFIHKMKSLMRKNKVLEAFWGGNLRNKNIDGTFVVEDESDGEENDETNDKSSDNDSESDDSESETEWKE